MPWTTPVTRATNYGVLAANWNELVGDLAFMVEVGRATFTVDVSVTGTAFVDVVSLGAITYEAVPHLFDFQCNRLTAGGSGTCALALRDSTTDLGRFFQAGTGETVRGPSPYTVLTPTAASHTYKVSAINSVSQTSTVSAGAGGAGNFLPGLLRVFRIPT